MRTPDKSWTRKDFNIDWFSGTGAGGQHRNKHQNCVRITHIESGITTVGQNHRERRRNFDEAFTDLVDKVVTWHYGEDRRSRYPGNTEVIRTYNVPDNRVVDHITGDKTTFDDFDLDQFITNKLSKLV